MMNRAFLYGDLLFESILIEEGKPQLVHAHFERLVYSAALLKLEFTLSYEGFLTQIMDTIEQSTLQNARLRFVVYRDAEGWYTPNANTSATLLEIFPLSETKPYPKLGLYTDNYKPCNELSGMKTGNALLYVMAGIWAKENNMDDAIILNEHGCVCEATSSNIFLVKDNIVYTPGLSEGCVDGVKRKQLIKQLQLAEYTIIEAPITVKQLKESDSVFLTNAIQGIVPVDSFEEIQYKPNEYVQRLMHVSGIKKAN